MNTYGNMFIDESVPRPNFGGRLVKAELAQAKLFRTDGELQRSRELAERLNRAFPESTQISAFLGRIYSDLREDERLREWLGTTPDGIQREPEYWFALGSWLQRQSRHREAVRCFAEAVLRDETDLFSYLGLASSLTFVDQQEAAQRVQQRYQLLAEAARIATFLGQEVGSRQQLDAWPTFWISSSGPGRRSPGKRSQSKHMVGTTKKSKPSNGAAMNWPSVRPIPAKRSWFVASI